MCHIRFLWVKRLLGWFGTPNYSSKGDFYRKITEEALWTFSIIHTKTTKTQLHVCKICQQILQSIMGFHFNHKQMLCIYLVTAKKEVKAESYSQSADLCTGERKWLMRLKPLNPACRDILPLTFVLKIPNIFFSPAEAQTECMLKKRLQTLTGLQDWGAIGQLQCSQISSRFSIHSPSE